jgi:CheY-like chemotaxis protein
LVEDEESVRSLTRLILQQGGYRVLEASNGEEALDALAQHREPIDLLVTDVVMPGVGGRELAERLLAKDPDLRILYLSGYTDDAVVRNGVLRDQVQFLQKPFTPAAFSQKVREVLDSPKN